MHRAFVVGGDAKDRGSSFHDGLSLLRGIHEHGPPFTEIGVPSYPEGHPDIADDVLLSVLREKQPLRELHDHADELQPERHRIVDRPDAQRRHHAAACTWGRPGSPSSRSS